MSSYINENNNGTSFSQEAKYSTEDWKKFVKLIENDYKGKYMIGNYNEDSDLYLVYMIDSKTNILKHIATYNYYERKLFTDDLTLFGYEKKITSFWDYVETLDEESDEYQIAMTLGAKYHKQRKNPDDYLDEIKNEVSKQLNR